MVAGEEGSEDLSLFSTSKRGERGGERGGGGEGEGEEMTDTEQEWGEKGYKGKEGKGE